MITGEKKAWETLKDLNPSDACKKSGARHDGSGDYILKSFGMDFSISVRKSEIKNLAPDGEILMQRYSCFFNLSALCYLINAKDIPLTGKLIKPTETRGGAMFFRGTHVLPLDKIAEKYGADKIGFIEKGKCLNGKILNYGDASVELLPLPRIPVTLILWLSDDEFPARADLLFDSSCERHLPLDILWSVAMLSTLVML